ncbi:MAG: iron ABC transporter permease [Lachnospiraceae bacterium]|nr:iron ABC transporter permease [Lachnospiraceae bacterium]
MKRYQAAYGILGGLLFALLVLNLVIGSVYVPPSQVFRIIFLRQETDASILIWTIRFPRTISAALLGGALSVAGLLLQTFFSNPIAGPFVLGISSGARLTVAVTMVIALSAGNTLSSWEMIIAAFVGSLASMGLVLLFSGRVRSISVLVVCGIMIGYICTAMTDFIVTFADDTNIVSLHNWTKGSFSGMTWGNVQVMFPVVIVSLLFAFMLSKPMGAYQLGESYARNLGINTRRFCFELIVLSSILSACVTAFAGPISFLGVAAPHLMKRLFRTERPILIIPACFLGGAAFCLLCDLIARTLFAPRELNISTVTAVFGAPIVIYIMLRKSRHGQAAA